MRLRIWIIPALLVPVAVAACWMAFQHEPRPSPVVALGGLVDGKVADQVRPARNSKAWSRNKPEAELGLRTWSSNDSTSPIELHLAPEAAYGAPPAADPPEVIQIDTTDPLVVEAIARYLKDSRPRLEITPIATEEIGPAEVVVNVLERPTLVFNSDDDTASMAWMPRCLPDCAMNLRMPYAGEPMNNLNPWLPDESCGDFSSGHPEIPLPDCCRMPLAGENGGSPSPTRPIKDSTRLGRHVCDKAPSPKEEDLDDLDLELLGVLLEWQREWAFSYFLF